MDHKDAETDKNNFSVYDLLGIEEEYISSVDPIIRLKKILDPISKDKISFNPEIIKRFSRRLGLGFDANLNAEGNVCLVNHEDVRPEYRLHFGYMDLVDFLYAALYEPIYNELFNDTSPVKFPLLPYPKDLATFWQLVQKGRKLRQNHY